MSADRVGDLEAQIAELKKRWPRHSVPPGMWDELEQLESDLEEARRAADADAPGEPGVVG